MKNPFRRRSSKARAARPAEPYALEVLEPRVLLAADLGAGLDVTSAWANETQERSLVAEAFDEAAGETRFGDLSRELSPLAGAIRQGIADGTAAPLDLAQLGGLLGDTSLATEQSSLPSMLPGISATLTPWQNSRTG